MKTTTFLITLSLLGGVSLAQAGDKNLGDGTLPDFLTQYDLDGNGRLDEEEVQAMRELRKQAREERRDEIDTNGDGVISDEEREAARAAMEAAIAAKRLEKFNELDTNDDDLLSREEFGAIPALADVEEDRVDAMFARLDTDGSGGITFEEFNTRLRHHRHHRPRPGDGGPRHPRDGSGDGSGAGPDGPRDGSGDGIPDGPGGPGDGGPGPGSE